MKAWSYWHQDILPHVAGCPIPVLEHELRRACQTFFTQSFAWQVTYAEQTVAANTEEVSIAPADSSQEVVRLEAVWINGKAADVFVAKELDRKFSDDWQLHTGTTPLGIVQLSPELARLYPIPSAACTFKIRASVQPSDTATGLPDDMATQYRDELAQGAKARLMLYPRAAWTDVAMAGIVGQAFSDGASAANVSATKSYGTGRIRGRLKLC